MIYILIGSFLFTNNRSVTNELISYQREKIDRISSLDIVLLGDSSLGNSLDAAILSENTGLRIENFALNGVLGYEGNYFLLKRIHNRHPNIKKVLLMQTIGLSTRSFSIMGVLENINSFDEFVDLDFKYKYKLIRGLPSYLNSIRLYQLVDRKSYIHNDYIKQKNESYSDSQIELLKKNYNPKKINDDKIYFLSKISKYCEENNIDLVYMHGPIYSEIKKNQILQLQRFKTKLDSMNIEYFNYENKLDLEELGDREDHLSPELKEYFTLNFLRKINHCLKNRIALVENFGSDFYISRLRFALFLKENNFDVTAIVPHDGYVDKIRDKGINVISFQSNIRGLSLSNKIKFALDLKNI